MGVGAPPRTCKLHDLFSLFWELLPGLSLGTKLGLLDLLHGFAC